MEETAPSIDDYIDIVRRRKMLFIFSVPVLLFLTVAITMILPPIYRADGVILIQGREISEDLVRSTVQSLAEEQIETTRQRIITSTKIEELIDTHGLYPDLRNKTNPSQLAENFRNSIGVQMIEAEVPGQWGQVSRENVAFVVSFLDKDPIVAHRVASDLADLFLEENVKARTKKADETAQFLKEEADRMQVRVQETENEIADFKIEYGDSLPELLQYNLTTVERLEEQIVAVQDESVTLTDQVHDLNLELSNVSPFVQYSSDTSGRAITPRQRLMELKEEYSRLIVSYADSHPDIVRLQQEIRIAEDEVVKTRTGDVSSEEAVNPLYRQLKSRIDSAGKELERLAERRKKLEADLVDYNNRVVRTHKIKRNYDEMTRDYNNKLEKYQDLRAKQLDANVAQNLEAEHKAGSFKLIEPPRVPDRPVKPNRLKLLFMGFVLSMGAGIGLMLAAEFLDNGVRGVAKVSQILGQPPLAVIPHIHNETDNRLRWRHRKLLLYIAGGFGILCLALFHFVVMDLGVLLMKVSSKISAL